jgi:heat shock protein HslJ
MKCVRPACAVALNLAAILSLAACASSPLAPSSATDTTTTTITAATVSGVLKLQSLTRADSTTVSVAEPDRFTVQFLDDNRIAVRADCNRGAGSFSANGNAVTVGPMAVTKAYCGSDSIDNEFLSLLEGTNVATVSSTSVVLTSARGSLQFSR